MIKMQHISHMARFMFLRAFFCTSFILLLALGALLGFHRARVNTEQICFGTTLPEWDPASGAPMRFSGIFVKM
jgi:hypothetical protein